jgi:thiaminase/transcriptional activator TenA
METTRFVDQLWVSIAPVYAAILAQPFIRELTDGSLSRERFVFYMKQDALYLQDFSRALAIAGARAPAVTHLQAYLAFASGAINVERALHESYFRDFEAVLDVSRSPACFAYTQFLLATASNGSHAEALAALLPCFWIYRDVGKEIVRRSELGLEHNPYRRWIETYSGEDFETSVERAIEITEAVAQEASTSERERMQSAFMLSSRLEWMFWDSAYRREQWPP